MWKRQPQPVVGVVQVHFTSVSCCVHFFFVNICDTTTDCVYVMWQLLKNVAYTSCVHTYKIVDSRKQEQEEYGTLAWQMWFLILQFLTFAFAFILDFTRPNLKHAHSAPPPPTCLLHFTPHSSLSLWFCWAHCRVNGDWQTERVSDWLRLVAGVTNGIWFKHFG